MKERRLAMDKGEERRMNRVYMNCIFSVIQITFSVDCTLTYIYIYLYLSSSIYIYVTASREDSQEQPSLAHVGLQSQVFTLLFSLSSHLGPDILYAFSQRKRNWLLVAFV